MSDGSDRRTSERIDTKGALKAHLSMEAEVLTLSPSGMGIRLAFAPDIGSRHSFTLAIGSEVLTLLGIVRNSEARPDDGTPSYVVGVEFHGLSAREEGLIEGFVAGLLRR